MMRASRSLRSRVFVGSSLALLGLLVLVSGLAATSVHWLPHFSGALHWIMVGVTASTLVVFGVRYLERGLSPLDQLASSLDAVRQGRSARLTGDFPSEVQPLVDELNGLLAHHETAVARAHHRAGDFAHGLKTPLAVLRGDIEQIAAAAPFTPDAALVLTSMREQIARMQRQTDFHLAHARAAASGSTAAARASITDAAEGLARTLHRLHAERGVEIEIAVPSSRDVRVIPEDLEEMLGNVLDNACRFARRRVVLSASAGEAATIRITIDDDGPGIAEALRDDVLQRGVRADTAAPGSGLGLAITRELAELYHGRLSLSSSPLGGLRAELELPGA